MKKYINAIKLFYYKNILRRDYFIITAYGSVSYVFLKYKYIKGV
jgi:hypothetical protein